MAIKIQTGPMPKMEPVGACGRQLNEVQQAILEMPAGSWFIVPDSAGKTRKALSGVRSGLSRFMKSRGVVGVAIGIAADGAGLVVRKTGELDTPARPQTTTGPGPVVSTRPKASRI